MPRELDNTSTLPAFFKWMSERHAIWERRVSGMSWPWTDDPILQEFKFTNVFRERDRGTEVLRRLNSARSLACRVFNVFLYRMINNAETFEETGLTSAERPWKQVSEALFARQQRGEKVFTSAHMTVGVAFEDKLVTNVRSLDRLWEHRYDVTELLGLCKTMQEAFQVVRRDAGVFGVGAFIGYEIVCDLRFFPEFKFTDTLTWANIGPGAKRGLRRLGLPVSIDSLVHLYDRCVKDGPPNGVSNSLAAHHVGWAEWNGVSPKQPVFELREIEHSLCEFDKYERVRLGQGRPRQRYRRPDNG